MVRVDAGNADYLQEIALMAVNKSHPLRPFTSALHPPQSDSQFLHRRRLEMEDEKERRTGFARLIEQRGYTLQEVSDLYEVRYGDPLGLGSISKWVRGVVLPSSETQIRLARLFNVKVSDLFLAKDDWVPPPEEDPPTPLAKLLQKRRLSISRVVEMYEERWEMPLNPMELKSWVRGRTEPPLLAAAYLPALLEVAPEQLFDIKKIVLDAHAARREPRSLL